MTRTRFHQGLDDLKQKLLTMGGLAEQAVERSVRAYPVARHSHLRNCAPRRGPYQRRGT